MIKLYQIKYLSTQELSGDVFDISEENDPTLKEFNALRLFCKSRCYRNDFYTGLVSNKFKKKTGLDIEEAKQMVEGDFDIVLFHPYPLELKIQTDFLHLAELEHPGLTQGLRKLWAYLYDEDLPIVSLPENVNFCVHCNYFVANSKFWSLFCKDLEKINDALQTEEFQFLLDNTPYNLSSTDKYMELFPFVFERFITHFLLKYSNEFKVKNICFEKNFHPVQLFKHESYTIDFFDKFNSLFFNSKFVKKISTKVYFLLRRKIFSSEVVRDE